MSYDENNLSQKSMNKQIPYQPLIIKENMSKKERKAWAKHFEEILKKGKVVYDKKTKEYRFESKIKINIIPSKWKYWQGSNEKAVR